MTLEAALSNPGRDNNKGLQIDPARLNEVRLTRPARLSSADVPKVTTNDADQNAQYPSTVSGQDLSIIRGLVEGPTLAQMAAAQAFASFIHNYNDRSAESRLPGSLKLYDASTSTGIKDQIVEWRTATDPALYKPDPVIANGRQLKPTRDTNAKIDAKNPAAFYMIGYDKEHRPLDVLEYYNDSGVPNYRAQYLFKYEQLDKELGTDKVSIFKYMADELPRGRDSSQAAGTLAVGANGHANDLVGLTEYYRQDGITYDARKYDGFTLQLPNLANGETEIDAKPTAKLPPFKEIYFHGGDNVTIQTRLENGGVEKRDLGGADALYNTFITAPEFYFYEPFGKAIPYRVRPPNMSQEQFDSYK